MLRNDRPLGDPGTYTVLGRQDAVLRKCGYEQEITKGRASEVADVCCKGSVLRNMMNAGCKNSEVRGQFVPLRKMLRPATMCTTVRSWTIMTQRYIFSKYAIARQPLRVHNLGDGQNHIPVSQQHSTAYDVERLDTMAAHPQNDCTGVSVAGGLN